MNIKDKEYFEITKDLYFKNGKLKKWGTIVLKEKFYVPISWLVWNRENPYNIITPGDGFIIHHIDGNNNNNCINNLQKMTNSDHTRLHNTGKNHSEKTKNKISKTMRTNHRYVHKWIKDFIDI